MFSKTLILQCSYCLTIISFLQTSHGDQNPYCRPSSCGKISNISYPFRLKDDPKHCGHPNYELACENNTASLYLDSRKHLVHEINYPNKTIRVADAAIKKDSCSLPMYSVSPYYISRGFVPYFILYDTYLPITFMSCPHRVSNLLDLETADCVDRKSDFNESNRRRTYIRFGELNDSYIMDLCTIDIMVMTSLMPAKEGKNVSLSEINSYLLYGFQLEWHGPYSKCNTCWFSRPNRDACMHYCKVGKFWMFRCEQWPACLVVVFNLSMWSLQYVTVAIRILIGMPGMLGLIICNIRRRRLSLFDTIEDFLQSNHNIVPIRYSYSDIRKITRGFREKLGEGGYGSVYKGKLRSGHHVAVKVLNKPRANGQDFINEVTTIGRIHHVNVVKLVGYCAERSKCALIYDFMPNGSLNKYIFTTQEISSPLSWERKYDIAVGVARGIEYLHRGCDIQILHFDIKPHNILIDDNFTPKISDFGLAKFYSIENNSVILTAARGTIGYVAPELINRSIGGVSYKADVYSFGMMLMEMIGLKRDMVANDNKSSQYFPYWIYDRFNKLNDMETGNVDKNHDDGDGDDDDENARKLVRKMTIVALWCILMRPADRPSMSEVLKMLEGENENLQVPPQPSQSLEFASYNGQMWETESTSSIALLCDDFSSDQ